MPAVNTLREEIAKAKTGGYALGHFNFATLDQLWAIARAAHELKASVLVGASEGERDFVGVRQAVALVQSMRKEDISIFLNADHTGSVGRVKEAIDAGFDMVIYDGSKLSFEENAAKTKECVEYARASGRETLIEGELGYIGEGSKIRDELPSGVALTEDELTTAEDAVRFVEETGVDLFSPAIGSVHGMLRGGRDPDVSVARIHEIAASVSVPLVLHGASGLSAENLRAAITAGISLVHISTELRVAWKQALKFSLQENLDEVAPYKILKGPLLAVEKLVREKLALLG